MTDLQRPQQILLGELSAKTSVKCIRINGTLHDKEREGEDHDPKEHAPASSEESRYWFDKEKQGGEKKEGCLKEAEINSHEPGQRDSKPGKNHPRQTGFFVLMRDDEGSQQGQHSQKAEESHIVSPDYAGQHDQDQSCNN